MKVESNLSIAQLAHRCSQETEKYARRSDSDPTFCFELLRRALAEGSSEAFTYVYEVYQQRVLGWVYQHSRFPLTGESAEYFAGIAFQNFYFALSGSKFDRFPTLAAVLTYLKTCVHTAIAQYLRDKRHVAVVPLDAARDVPEEADLAERMMASELWDHICRLLTNERDRLLARCAFVLGMKPRQICTAYGAYWSSEREVSVALYRIRRVLRSDAELAVLASRGSQAEME